MKTRSIFHSSIIVIATALAFLPRLEAQQAGIKASEQRFFFKGGTPSEFVRSIDEHFGMNGELVEIAMIDPAMREVVVPKISIRKGDALAALLVYDELTNSNPRLGKLSVASQEQSREIHSLSFIPATAESAGGPESVARIYNIRGVADEDPKALEERFDALNALVTESGGVNLELRHHSKGGLLLVRAPEHHHVMVDSLIKAYREEVQADLAEAALQKDRFRKLEDNIEEGKRILGTYMRAYENQKKTVAMIEEEFDIAQARVRDGTATAQEASEVARQKLSADTELGELRLKSERIEIELSRFMEDMEELQKAMKTD